MISMSMESTESQETIGREAKGYRIFTSAIKSTKRQLPTVVGTYMEILLFSRIFIVSFHLN